MSESDFKNLTKSQAVVAALKSLLLSRIEAEKEFEIESYQLQMKFQERFSKIQEKAEQFIASTDVDYKDCEKLFSICPKNEPIDKLIGEVPPETKGVSCLSHYWSIVLQNTSLISQMIAEPDIDALNHLVCIRGYQTSADFAPPNHPEFNSTGLYIEFEFSANPYFSNKQLYKFYRLGFQVDASTPFENDGLMPLKVEASKIDWLPGKNLTMKTVEKKQKSKKTKQIRVVTKTEILESFFNFFTPLEDAANQQVEDEKERQLLLSTMLLSDYDIACDLFTEIVPRSVLYFTGEACDDESDYECDSAEESDDSSEESDSSAPQSPKKKLQNKAHGRKHN